MDGISENKTKISNINDHIIATDFLLSSKSCIKSYASALSETASPDVRSTLKRHLDDAISNHEKIINYMMANGYYHPYNPQEQFKVDMNSVDTALNFSK